MRINYKTNPKANTKTNSRPARWILFCLLFIFFIAFLLFAKGAYESIQNRKIATETENLGLPNLADITALTTESSSNTAEWQSLTYHPGDSLTTLLTRAKISQTDIQEILDIKLYGKYLKKIRPGQVIKIRVGEQNQLLAYSQEIEEHKLLNITKGPNGYYQPTIELAPLETRIAFGKATIKDSLFVSGIRAGMDDALIMKLAEIFAYDIDFALDIRPNDSFSLLYEEKYLEGTKIGTGPIVAAEFKTQGRTHRAVRYTDEHGKSQYFSPNGKGLHKAFIRTPVNYTRISSHFNLNRHHPILHTLRAHKGVDYAAPRGTPVKSVGDGVVSFLGRKGGYGNTLMIQHGKKYKTVYAHLSRFATNLKSGAKVKQGQVVAYVGSSGLATGPHLHFEFQVDGVHRNPLTVALPKSEGLQGLQAPRFLEHAKNMLTLMAYHDKLETNVMVASNE